MRYLLSPDAVRTKSMDSAALRASFLIQTLFKPGTVECVYSDVDRAVIGSAVPSSGALKLGADAELRADYFCQRRELGVLNIGGPGAVVVDGKAYEMDALDCLYVGRGAKDVSFSGSGAKFYLLSYPAHATYPTTLAKKAQATAVNLGADATSNKRTIFKYIHADGIKSCQLVLGFTELATGSVWNTMPPHTHHRRSEVYMYFNLATEARVVHLMGEPSETRHLFVANEQAAVSPIWSIHAGCGTGSYSFCWGMGGENQEFTDMDAAPVPALR